MAVRAIEDANILEDISENSKENVLLPEISYAIMEKIEIMPNDEIKKKFELCKSIIDCLVSNYLARDDKDLETISHCEREIWKRERHKYDDSSAETNIEQFTALISLLKPFFSDMEWSRIQKTKTQFITEMRQETEVSTTDAEAGVPASTTKKKTYTQRTIERARSVWEVLVQLAQNKQTITYKALGRQVKAHHRTLRYPLHAIQDHCRGRLPHLTILVVRQVDNQPGPGCDAVPDPEAERKKVYEFDWSKEKNPF